MSISFLKSALLASTVMVAAAGSVMADGNWAAAPDKIDGRIRAGSRDVPVLPGEETTLQVRRLTPGATITVMRGTELLTPEPVTVDGEGNAKVAIKIPADAEPGNQPLTVISSNPNGVMLVNLNLAKIVPPSNQDAFTLTSAEVGERAYQAAVSDDGKLFVASARGPNEESRLIRFNGETMEMEAEAKLAPSANAEDGVVDVFGVAVDDANGNVWTTNTLNDTISVYKADDLSLVKVFEEGLIGHPRDVTIDEATNRAYVNVALTGNVEVFDTKTLEHIDTLHFETPRGREVFGTMALDLDSKAGRLYSISRSSPFAGWIDLKTGESTAFEVPGLSTGSGIAHDPETGRMYLAGFDSSNLIVLDDKGEVLANTYIGAGGLSVVWDATTKQAYVAARAAGTITVVDADGKIVANLPVGYLPNHLTVGADGSVYGVTMFGEADDSDQHGAVTRIVAQK